MNKFIDHGSKIQLEYFEDWTISVYESTFPALYNKLGNTVKLLFTVANGVNGTDAFFVGEQNGKLFYRYTNVMFGPSWSIRYCTPETLRKFVDGKASEKNNIVYWREKSIKEFLDALEESRSVPEGAIGTVS